MKESGYGIDKPGVWYYPHSEKVIEVKVLSLSGKRYHGVWGSDSAAMKWGCARYNDEHVEVIPSKPW